MKHLLLPGAPFAFQYWWGLGHLLRKGGKEKRRMGEKRKEELGERRKGEKSKEGNIGKGRMVATCLVGLAPSEPLPKSRP